MAVKDFVEKGTACGIMAVALPAVVEELLNEMAAAVRETARSTGRKPCVAALWAAEHFEARAGGAGARGRVVPGHTRFGTVTCPSFFSLLPYL